MEKELKIQVPDGYEIDEKIARLNVLNSKKNKTL